MAANLLQALHKRLHDQLAGIVGGTRRLQVITLLACVLALDAADKAAVGAVAMELKRDLSIDNLQVGWLIAVSTAVGVVATLPFGMYVDRVRRTPLLAGCIVVWSIAMILGGMASSYHLLLLSRLLLGAVVAAAAPAVVSLTGDFFRAGERGRIFGYIFIGELLGIAFGFLVCGNLAAWLSWRWAFWVMGVLGLVLAWFIHTALGEPERGGRGVLHPPIGEDDDADGAANASSSADLEPDKATLELEDAIHARGIEPIADQVLRDDPSGWTMWQSVRYILANRSFRWLIIASALGYFYLSGLRTFGVVFMGERFGLGQGSASTLSVGIGMGAVVGVIVAGRLSDSLIARGRLEARVLVGAAAYLFATVVIIPGLLSGSLIWTAPLLFLGAAGVGGTNPPVDAARLDVMHWSLWGRAEAVRATVRYAFEAAAPPIYGYAADLFTRRAGPDAGPAIGLRDTLLITLVSLAVAGVVMLARVRRSYLADTATALASGAHGTPRA